MTKETDKVVKTAAYIFIGGVVLGVSYWAITAGKHFIDTIL